MPSSAALATKMVERFRPRYIVMLGICAGVKGKTELGDVKSAAAITIAQRSGALHLVAISRPTESYSPKGRTAAAPGGKFSVRVGPMASGAAVLATNGALDPITAQRGRELPSASLIATANDVGRNLC